MIVSSEMKHAIQLVYCVFGSVVALFVLRFQLVMPWDQRTVWLFVTWRCVVRSREMLSTFAALYSEVLYGSLAEYRFVFVVAGQLDFVFFYTNVSLSEQLSKWRCLQLSWCPGLLVLHLLFPTKNKLVLLPPFVLIVDWLHLAKLVNMRVYWWV